MFNGLKRVILWDYPRASWQYDIMVGFILLFILLTPRAWFHDQPRVPQTHEVTPLAGGSVYWVEPAMLRSIPPDAPEQQRFERLSSILKKRTGHQTVITRIEPVYDSEHELTGYMAVAKP